MTQNRITEGSHNYEHSGFIQTRCPREFVTDEMAADCARQSGLPVGDTLIIQCMNFERTDVLHQRSFLVYMRREEMRTEVTQTRGQYEQTHTKTAVSYGVMPLGDWLTTPAGHEIEKAEKKATAATIEEVKPGVKGKKAA